MKKIWAVCLSKQNSTSQHEYETAFKFSFPNELPRSKLCTRECIGRVESYRIPSLMSGSTVQESSPIFLAAKNEHNGHHRTRKLWSKEEYTMATAANTKTQKFTRLDSLHWRLVRAILSTGLSRNVHLYSCCQNQAFIETRYLFTCSKSSWIAANWYLGWGRSLMSYSLCLLDL